MNEWVLLVGVAVGTLALVIGGAAIKKALSGPKSSTPTPKA